MTDIEPGQVRPNPRARQFLDTVLDNPERGASVAFSAEGQARNFLQQCYTIKSRDRQKAKRLPREDPMYNCSPHDDIHVGMAEFDGEWRVVAQMLGNIDMQIKAADGTDL